MAVHVGNEKRTIVRPITSEDIMAKKRQNKTRRQAQENRLRTESNNQPKEETMNTQSNENQGLRTEHVQGEVFIDNPPQMEKMDTSSESKSEDQGTAPENHDDTSEGSDGTPEGDVEMFAVLLTKIDHNGDKVMPARLEIPRMVGEHKLSRMPHTNIPTNAATSASGVRLALEDVSDEHIMYAVKSFNDKYNKNPVTGKYNLELLV